MKYTCIIIYCSIGVVPVILYCCIEFLSSICLFELTIKGIWFSRWIFIYVTSVSYTGYFISSIKDVFACFTFRLPNLKKICNEAKLNHPQEFTIDWFLVRQSNKCILCFCRTLMMFARSYFCKVKEWVRKCILTMK